MKVVSHSAAKRGRASEAQPSENAETLFPQGLPRAVARKRLPPKAQREGDGVSRKPNGVGIEEGTAATRRVKLFSNLALAALLSIILLTLSFWLGGFHLPFLSATADQPGLSISSGPYQVGSVVKLQGVHFSRYTIIALLRDGQPATDSNGMRLAVDSDGQGAFTTTLTITADWSPGDHIIAAQDTTGGQRASIDISVDNTTGPRGD